MLTPEKIKAFNEITGGNVPLQPGAQPDRAQEILDIAAKARQTKARSEFNSTSHLGQGPTGEITGNTIRTIAEPLIGTGGAIESGLDETAGRLGHGIASGGKDFSPTQTGQEAFDTADKSTASHDDTLAGHIGDFIGTVAPYLTGTGEAATAEKLATFTPKIIESLGMNAEAIAPKIASYLATKAPTIARDTAIGTAQTGDIGQGALQGAVAGLPIQLGKGVRKVAQQATKTAPDAVERSIDAVNPLLKGKTKAEAYVDIVRGNREAKPAHLFQPQGVTPTQEIKDLGTRLSDVLKSEDPLDNLVSLGKDLNTTEGKLYAKLAGDPEMQYTADKQTLKQRLVDAQKQIPREFASIRDSKSVFNNVFDYAKELAQKADDTIAGIRDARVKFDSQAKLEYPGAFKEGYIDMKTPAGRAIKQARDVFNEHLYETAPNGSEIKDLIRREADIFNATDHIAQKAAQLHGLDKLNKVQKFFKEHPIALTLGAAAAIGGGATAVGSKIVNAATGNKE